MEPQHKPLNELRQEISQTWRLALPMILGQVGQMSMGVVDTIIAGKINTDVLAGLGLGSIILWQAMMVLMGVLIALDTFFSQSVGAKNENALRHWLMQALWLAAGLSLLCMVGLWGANFSYRAFAPSSEANQQFSVYLLNAIWSIPAIFVFFLLQRYWQAQNRVLFLASVTIGANGLNLIVNLALGLGWWGFPQWGTAGIAAATVISRWAMVLIAILYTALMLDRNTWLWKRPNWSAQRSLLKLGWPAGGQALSEISVFAIASLIAGFMGAVQLASHHICLTVAAFTYMFSNGVASAAAVRVGHAIGAENEKAAQRSGTVALSLSALIMAGFSTGYLWVPKQIASIFTTDPAVIELTTTLFLVVAIFQIADGLQVTAAGALRGLGNTRAPMIANGIGHFLVGFPISLACAFLLNWGVLGLWVGLAAGLICVALLVVRIWLKSPASAQVIGN